MERIPPTLNSQPHVRLRRAIALFPPVLTIYMHAIDQTCCGLLEDTPLTPRAEGKKGLGATRHVQQRILSAEGGIHGVGKLRVADTILPFKCYQVIEELSSITRGENHSRQREEFPHAKQGRSSYSCSISRPSNVSCWGLYTSFILRSYLGLSRLPASQT